MMEESNTTSKSPTSAQEFLPPMGEVATILSSGSGTGKESSLLNAMERENESARPKSLNQTEPDLSSLEHDVNSDSDEVEAKNSGKEEEKLKKKRKLFTKSEDEQISEGVKKGMNWDDIVKQSQMQRTPSQIKERWRRISAKEAGPPTSTMTPTKRRKTEEFPPSFEEDETPQTPTKNSTMQSAIEGQMQRIEEENQRLREKEKELEEREHAFQMLLRSESEKGGKQELLRSYRKTLQDCLIREAKNEKERARSKLQENCYRVGKIIHERHGTSYSEAWQDGYLFREQNNRLIVLNEQKENIEKQKRELAKRVKKQQLNESEILPSHEIENLLRQEEILKLRLHAIKKEETDLSVEREKLLLEKNRHIREIKRINDEDASHWKDQQILKDRYILLTLLGKGGFSEVYKAFDMDDMQYVACKIHQLNTMWPEKKKENYMKHALRESEIHKSVVHNRIVRLYDVFEINENSFCTILEYCNGQDLDIYLKTQSFLTEREAKSIITQIFSGLAYLNELKKPIIHYDLKPGNILLSDGEVKITDFGLSKIMEEDQDALELTSQGAGTYWYLPPECFEMGKEPPKISSKVDVWSAGVIFFQMLYGKKPFGNNVSQQKILQDKLITNAILDFPSKPAVSQQAKDFIKRCLTSSQHGRPDVKLCYQDPYLKLSGQKKEKKEMIKPPPKLEP
eukprot:TRINITY_DN4804_c0_g1_i1.p1 TRINITY_DN4804_c0_g1~~TRINITY_DN4804_c0_g1_i1.p1  ORF type:complete len:683 (+),score=211.14 TRINITY_DN4804_c0_g1_i1:73-2121(+)